MAKEKQDISPEQFNEFLTYVATKVEPTQIKDIFTGKALQRTIGMFKEDNPLIKSYQLTGTNFINNLLKDKTDFNLTNDDKKLIIEVGAFGDPDPRSGFRLNYQDPEMRKIMDAYSEDLKIKKEELSTAEYESYRADARKKLVAAALSANVKFKVFDEEAPKLDFYTRDRSKPLSDFITQELNMQSGYGFTPEIPDFAGGTIGQEYIPANDQERYRTTTTSSEVGPDTTTTRDRLKNFYPDEESGYLSGPEGLFYNPEAEQFLRQQDVYGPAPELQGYQYDPRLKEILSKAVNPNYGSQFNQGGLTGYAKGGNMNIKEQTQNVANQGRYGDSMLLHVNPAEVKGLAQAMPITINPETGQPEAFLPFLAPILGSMAGSALFGGSALAAGIGAGLATYAQTGGSGSKALLSSLTAGFGSSAMNKAVPAVAQTGTDAATQLATSVPANLGIDTATQAITQNPSQIASQAVSQAGTQAATAPSTWWDAGKRMFTQGPEGTFDFDAGAKSLASAAMSPSGMVAGTALGGRAIINSQELFEEQMRQLELDEEERKRAMYANNPEAMLYSASGGMTQFQGGGDTDYDYESNKLQVYAPAKTQYQVNPDFMAGFAPETMYFRPDTINSPSMSTLGGSVPKLGPDTYTGTKGGYDYEGSFDADGNYIPGTAQGVQIAPQVSIDPYGAYSGSAPLGLVQSEYNPYPVQPIETLPIDDSDYTDIDIGIGDGEDGSFYEETDNSDQGYFSDMDLNLAGAMGGFNPTDYMGASGITNQFFLNKEIQDYLDSLNNPTTDIGDYFTADGPMGKAKGGVTKYANQGQTEIMSPPVDDFRQDPLTQEEVTNINTDPLTQEVTMFILGESDNQEAVNQFVNKYGVEAFTQLREQILQSLVPNAQTSGLIEGVGNGGMDDDIMGTIGGKEKIAVSQDEFIVPADVVSGIGDGSSNAGAKELYAMMDRVRQKRTGTTKQPAMLANAGGLLPV